MKLCVFSNDPVITYFKKGEIKDGYFNPQNIFDEIHVISPSKNEIEEDKVKNIAGNASLFIHPIGQPTLLNSKSKLKTVRKIIKKINPQVIRTYNPLMQGWLATKIAKELEIPIVLSLHNNYDDMRKIHRNAGDYKRFLKLTYTKIFIERYTISNASKIICSYRFLIPYAKNLGGKNIQVIYNKVNLSKFSPEIKSKFSFKEPVIIYVARLDEEKNHKCIIKAIKDLPVKLLLIGKGPLKNDLMKMVDELELNEKIIFIDSVLNEELAEYYNSAEIFAAPIKQGGVSIPMLEAMACGLPLIIRKSPSEREDIDDAALMVENNPESFSRAITDVLNDRKLREDLRRKSLEMAKKMDGKIMEEKEAQLYLEIIGKH